MRKHPEQHAPSDEGLIVQSPVHIEQHGIGHNLWGETEHRRSSFWHLLLGAEPRNPEHDCERCRAVPERHFPYPPVARDAFEAAYPQSNWTITHSLSQRILSGHRPSEKVHVRNATCRKHDGGDKRKRSEWRVLAGHELA